MARPPIAEGYRYDNHPPAPHPVRSRFQKDQSFGWLSGAGVLGGHGGGKPVVIGDASPVGRRLFERVNFSTGDQKINRRGAILPPYGVSE